MMSSQVDCDKNVLFKGFKHAINLDDWPDLKEKLDVAVGEPFKKRETYPFLDISKLVPYLGMYGKPGTAIFDINKLVSKLVKHQNINNCLIGTLT